MENENNPYNYDDETLELIAQAKARMARDHDIAGENSDDADAASNFMHRQNAALEAAAQQIRAANAEASKRKKGMVKQRTVAPKAAMPTAAEMDALPEQELPAKKPAVQQELPKVVVPEQQTLVEKPVDKVLTMPTQHTTQVPEHRPDEPKVDYDAFTKVSWLPSGGHFYDAPLYGQSLKVIDMLLLNNITQFNVVDVMTEILGRRIKGVAPEDILACDEVYLLQWLRASSFPDSRLHVGGFTCTNEKCKYEYKDPEYAVNFAKLQFRMRNPLQDVVPLYADGCHHVTLPNGRKCDIYPRRRSHDKIVQDWQYEYFDKHHDFPNEAFLNIANVAVNVEIEGCEGLQDKMDFIGNMSISDGRKFYEMKDKSALVSDVYVEHKCPKCGAKVDTEFPFRLDEYVSGIWNEGSR